MINTYNLNYSMLCQNSLVGSAPLLECKVTCSGPVQGMVDLFNSFAYDYILSAGDFYACLYFSNLSPEFKQTNPLFTFYNNIYSFLIFLSSPLTCQR